MAVKPGTPHPTKKGLVMGKNGRYVAKGTYAKQVKAAKEAAKANIKPQGNFKAPNIPKPKPSRQNVTPSKPKPSKPNPYTSGKPNPNAGGGVKGKPAPKSGGLSAYKNDVAALKRLVKAGGPLARQAAKRLAVLGVRVAPGAAVAGAIAGSAGRPGAAQMSKLGLRPGKSTKSADAPTYNTPLNQNSKPKPKPKPTTTTASKPKPKPTTKPTSRQNVTPSKPKPKPKPKPQTSGVGPVASGRTYSVQKTGKSVMQQQADELRAMRKASQERQAADKKKLEASKKKRKYGR